jgi:hypothetical protein
MPEGLHRSADAPVCETTTALAVAFTKPPALLVRAGRSYGTAFPVCTCDACGADAAEEASAAWSTRSR